MTNTTTGTKGIMVRRLRGQSNQSLLEAAAAKLRAYEGLGKFGVAHLEGGFLCRECVTSGTVDDSDTAVEIVFGDGCDCYNCAPRAEVSR